MTATAHATFIVDMVTETDSMRVIPHNRLQRKRFVFVFFYQNHIGRTPEGNITFAVT